MVVYIVRDAGGSTKELCLIRGLNSFSTSKETSSGNVNTLGDEWAIVRSSVEGSRYSRDVLGSEVVDEHLLDRSRAGGTMSHVGVRKFGINQVTKRVRWARVASSRAVTIIAIN